MTFSTSPSPGVTLQGGGSSGGSTFPVTGGGDTFLTRKSTANIRLGAADAAAPVAQTLSVQSVVAGTTNTAGTNFIITGSQGTGSGAGGSLIYQVAPANGGGGATVQNPLVTALTIDSTQTAIFSGNIGLYSSTALRIGSSSVNWQIVMQTTNIGQGSNNFYGFFNGTNLASGGAFDVRLYRDGPNTLALKNSANAQEFRVYENETGTIYKAILGNRGLMKISGAAFDNGAGASAGTLTNAPAVGNPTKWIPIDDNGTTRYVPAW
jgi:hypothetical protein